MEKLNLTDKLRRNLDSCLQGLRGIYQQELVSVILYGSAASAEFVNNRSNINLLVVLNDTNLESLAKSYKLINKAAFLNFQPLFFTENYIDTSCDVFPIEFLDMRENYAVLFGKDVLKDLKIDIKNLRFQCEQELKLKLINIRRFYLRNKKDKAALKDLLFKTCTSTIHILRNLVRLKNKQPVYLKEEVLVQVKGEFDINIDNFTRILEAKNKNLRLNYKEIEKLLFGFTRNLQAIIDLVDKI